MPSLIVVDNPEDWPHALAGVEVIAARQYLTDSAFINRRNLRIFNLCRSYRYQSIGYYVSLLAAAREHRPLPDVQTIQSPSMFSFLKRTDYSGSQVIGHRPFDFRRTGPVDPEEPGATAEQGFYSEYLFREKSCQALCAPVKEIVFAHPGPYDESPVHLESAAEEMAAAEHRADCDQRCS